MVYTGIIAFGLTLVMMTGNIDLSRGQYAHLHCAASAPTIMMSTDNPAAWPCFGTLGSRRHLRPVQRRAGQLCKAEFSFITTLGTSSIFTRAGA